MADKDCIRSLKKTREGRIALAVAQKLIKDKFKLDDWKPEYLATWFTKTVRRHLKGRAK